MVTKHQISVCGSQPRRLCGEVRPRLALAPIDGLTAHRLFIEYGREATEIIGIHQVPIDPPTQLA
jgi:hypothetical protein